ncbi:MAG: 3-phenylpropionate dioxygenase [Betaproteobacteria bacterium]|nr:3-phenylpropionate dioxygenase [Betaproteobacteria bacterium]
MATIKSAPAPEGTAGAAPPTEEDVQTLLKIGLRNRWYALCPSHFVGDKPLSLYRLGLKLVLWRELGGGAGSGAMDGVVHVQEDHCPHRGAPLSLARHLGNRIACVYHGVEIGGDGTVLSVPGSPGCRLEGQRAVMTYASQEVNGAIYAWFGDALHAEPQPLQLPPQLVGEDYDRFLCYTEWRVDYRYGVDNNLDPMHGTFLHRQSHSMAAGDIEAKFRIRNTETGFVFEKVTQRDVNFDWSEWCDPHICYARLEIPYPKTGGPGGNFGIIFMGTPIGDGRCANFFWRNRKVAGWQRNVWRFLYRNRLEARHWAVLEQDRALMEEIEPDACEREFLYDHDTGVSWVRRWMRSEAEAQLAALAAAGLPLPWQSQGLATPRLAIPRLATPAPVTPTPAHLKEHP